MQTTVTIVLTTCTNTKPQAKEHLAWMLEHISKDVTAYGVITVNSGGPEGNYTIKIEES